VSTISPDPEQPEHAAQFLLQALEHWARVCPARRAYVFVDERGNEARQISYAELLSAVTRFASVLSNRATPGERALLVFPTRLEFIIAFLGCLHAGVVAVPMSPPGRNLSPRLALAIAADCGATVLLSVSSLLEALQPALAAAPHIAALALDALDLRSPAEQSGAAPALGSVALTPDSLAFIQYTSGSTALPKGVMVTHANLIANQRMLYAAFEHSPASTVVGWAPFFHDQGLVGNVLHPLYSGSECVLMSPSSFLKRPLLWPQMISKYRAHTSGGPNFAYDFCAQRVSPEQLEGLDLSCWTIAFNGAEPVSAATMRRFAQVFAPAGFREQAFFPCYGMAEATLYVTGPKKGRALALRDVASQPAGSAAPCHSGEKQRQLVGCGSARFGARVVIVQPSTRQRCAPGEEGEVWIAGPNVAVGYWNKPEASLETFGARLSNGDGQAFLRSGDLGLLDEHGELFITGRMKEVLIVLGRNHYPQDIERTVEQSHPALRPHAGAAFSFETEKGEQLAIVQEVQREQEALDEAEVVAAIRRAVAAEHGLTAHTVWLLRPGSVPKTTSGKIQRRLTRQLFQDGRLQPIRLPPARSSGAEASALGSKPVSA
jgi:acyl-CoA synthetase (AMP-forming)/AMP-acid ligase II